MAESTASPQKSGKTVLIAFDGSDYAKYAMKYFADHIQLPSDHVIVIYCAELNEIISTEKTIYGLSESGAHISLDNEDFRELIHKEIEKIKSKLIEFSRYMQEIKLHGTVKSTYANSPGVGIIKAANELDVDLIVTGSRGCGKLRRTFMGSVSDYILHHSDVPVMIVTLHKDHSKDQHKHDHNNDNQNDQIKSHNDSKR